MNEEERLIARRAIKYLKKHGLTIHQGWTINGEPPEDVAEYLDNVVTACFPSDEDEVEKQVIGLIEGELNARLDAELTPAEQEEVGVTAEQKEMEEAEARQRGMLQSIANDKPDWEKAYADARKRRA